MRGRVCTKVVAVAAVAGVIATMATLPPAKADALDGIHRFCVGLWGTDMVMLERCRNGQIEAMEQLVAWLEKHDVNARAKAVTKLDDDPYVAIYSTCSDRWLGDGPDSGTADYKMTARCIQKQVEAYNRMAQ